MDIKGQWNMTKDDILIKQREMSPWTSQRLNLKRLSVESICVI